MQTTAFDHLFKPALLIAFFYCAICAKGQKNDVKTNDRLAFSTYSVANAHSHNDYQQAHPFTTAYHAKFGSMEADIFLDHDSLYVGHVKSDIALHRSLASVYLDSLLHHIKQNNGFPYTDNKRHLQLLIDLKTDGVQTLAALIKLLQAYPPIIHSNHLRIVITGNRPPVKAWPSYPSFIWFDGNIGDTYPSNVLPKIAMMSGDFANFIKWNGVTPLAYKDSLQIVATVLAVHRQGKKIRFWGAPDIPTAWQQFKSWQVDWINTDHIDELAAFLQHAEI